MDFEAILWKLSPNCLYVSSVSQSRDISSCIRPFQQGDFLHSLQKELLLVSLNGLLPSNTHLSDEEGKRLTYQLYWSSRVYSAGIIFRSETFLQWQLTFTSPVYIFLMLPFGNWRWPKQRGCPKTGNDMTLVTNQRIRGSTRTFKFTLGTLGWDPNSREQDTLLCLYG